MWTRLLSNTASHKATIPLICLVAFALRVGASYIGDGHFWSYTAYYILADTLVHGGGYCMEPGRLCAFFPPVFPTIVGAGILTGDVKAGVVVLNSLAGAGTVWLTWKIGARLFSPVAGLLPAVYVALYPYYVWHDGVLQENAVLAFVIALTLWLLIQIPNSESRLLWLSAGMMLSVAVLTKANLLSYLPLAILWAALAARGSWAQRTRPALYMALGAILLLGPWVARTWAITGAPILYSNGGFSLWTSNHRLTFDYFPSGSIDSAQEAEWLDVPPAERHAVYEMHDVQFIRQTRWFWKRGMEFIRANPVLTARRAVQKVWVAFSPVFSPEHSLPFNACYALSYLPLLLTAPIGIWRARRDWRTHGFIYLLIASFMLNCAIFWGHTSHRMFLEPYLMIFAASVIVRREVRTSI